MKTDRHYLKMALKIAGGSSALARALGGITPQAVSLWKRVPASRVLDVEAATGVRRWFLRPDIYPCEDNARYEGISPPLFSSKINPSRRDWLLVATPKRARA